MGLVNNVISAARLNAGVAELQKIIANATRPSARKRLKIPSETELGAVREARTTSAAPPSSHAYMYIDYLILTNDIYL